MGAGLSVQVLNATVFLSLTQEWQYIFQGFLIVAAALIYSQVRRSWSSRRGRLKACDQPMIQDGDHPADGAM